MTQIRDHQVPGPHARRAEPIAEVRPSRRPTVGEQARTLLAAATQGCLSTIGLEPPGYPFGSVAPFGLLDDGSPILFMSALAEHASNLDADPRASLLVQAPKQPGDPLAGARVTVVGDVSLVAGQDVPAAREAYLAANPDAAGYIDFRDFTFRRLAATRVRWVGGFGRMGWSDANDYATAAPDPVAASAAGAIAHLNDDHADAMLAIARAFTGYPDATEARAVHLDRYGIDLYVKTPRGSAEPRAGFLREVDRAESLRAACVELTRAAREAVS